MEALVEFARGARFMCWRELLTYGHLARDADDYDRALLDAYDQAEAARGHVVGTSSPDGSRGRPDAA